MRGFHSAGGRKHGRATVQQRLRELRHVIGGREQSGVAGNSSHAARSRIVGHATQHLAGALVAFGGRDARLPIRGRKKTRRGHAQRTKYIGLSILIERHTADALHQFAQHHKIDVAIQEHRARRINQLLGVGARITLLRAAPILLQIKVGPQAGVVRQQHANGHIVFAVLRELRNVLGDRIVQLHLSQLHQAHDAAGGGHHLGQRGHVENGVDGHRLLVWVECAITECLAINEAPVVAHQHHRSGRTPFLDRVFEQSIEWRKAVLLLGGG